MKLRKKMKALGLYLHIPFCIQKCRYCDFLSYTGSDKDLQLDYIKVLLEEIKNINIDNYSIDSIFIGGGTPTILEADIIARILTLVYKTFSVQTDVEITIESNPKTLTKRKLTAYKEIGINRLSIGAQSLNNDLLSFLGRIHNSEDFLRNFKEARNCGFENINVDLMFAIPGQTIVNWIDTLEQVLELNPEHISFYSLQIEEGTPFFQMFQEGSLQPINDDTDREMYRKAVLLLQKHDYLHYEISNAAKPGRQCRHNLKYWSMQEYLGLGLGAHSYLDGLRFSNETDLKKYLNRRGTFLLEPKPYESPYVTWKHMNTKQDEISEYIFTGMRKIEGISLNDFKQRFGVSLTDIYETQILKHIYNGLIELDQTEQRIRFTKRGIDLANTVLVDFV